MLNRLEFTPDNETFRWVEQDETWPAYAGALRTRRSVYERFPRVGPIPRGLWAVGAARKWRGMPFVYDLTPHEGTETFGRTEFLIHGDNAIGDASTGCIILDRPHRLALALAQESGTSFCLAVL